MKPDGHDDGAPAAGGPYRFDDVVVDAAAHVLSRDGQVQAVEPKVFAALLVLLRHAGQLVPRDDLLDAVWGHRHVTPGVLTRAIAQLRDALGDDAQHPRYIQTQHAVGYRFIGTLIPEPPESSETTATHEASAQSEAGKTPAPPVAEAHQALPYAGQERRDQHRAWRWSWPALVLLGIVLGVVVWLDRRSAQQETPLPAEPSIAVLPFSNLGADRNNDYFAEGLTAEMHDALSGVRGLKVAAPVSPAFVARYPQDVKSLGRTLGVATVLDASVRRDGDRVRINARLSDTGTGYTLWSHAYDRDLSDVFATQTEIADEVLGSLLEVLPQQREALARRLAPTRNFAAFDAYLRGLAELLQPGPGDSSRSAVGFFKQALTADSGFARAQASICRVEVSDFINRHDDAALHRAESDCKRAGDMEPGSSSVALALGDLYDAKSNHGKAIEYYTRAAADPARRPAAYVGIASVLAGQGKDAQALEYFDRALELRPGDASIHANIGYQHYLAGRLPQAIASYRKAVELDPDDAIRWGYLGGLYATAGRIPDAERAMARSIAIKPNYVGLAGLGELKYLSGDYAQAVQLRRKALQLDDSDYETWGNLGQALLAVPATAPQAADAFHQAAVRAQRYVDARPDDAMAVAQLGWFQANLDQPALARQLLARSEALGGEPGEVALMNAQTLTRLGETDGARERIVKARSAGIAAFRIDGNAALRRTLDAMKAGRTAAGTPAVAGVDDEPNGGE